MYDLNGKVAFVTGAGSRQGLGRSIALRLADEGADVAISDLRPMALDGWRGADGVAEEIAAKGRRSLAVYGDISDPAAVDGMVGAVVAALGRVDIFVANAASATGPDRVPVVDLPEDALDLTLAVNVKGTFLCCQAIGRHMVARGGGGKIIIMSSGMGKRATANNAAYSSSKFALTGLTQSLAHELGPAGITVNAICPGSILTDRIAEIAAATAEPGQSVEQAVAAVVQDAVAQTALKRLGTQDDVANLAAFLSSDQSDFLTGLAISVSGGSVMI